VAIIISSSCCSQLVLEEIDVPYILFVLEAEEFAVMVGENKLHTHIVSVQARYPGFTICYLVNKLKWFLQKKEQAQYKNGESGWKCPHVQQVNIFSSRILLLLTDKS
jgi:crossover junction endonuclease EME1